MRGAPINSTRIQEQYDRLLSLAGTCPGDPEVLAQASEWQQGKWKSYLKDLLARIPIEISGRTTLDFGCKYGLLFPLLLELGAERVFGVEDLNRYITSGEVLFSHFGDRVLFLKAECGYTPLQPDTVHLAILNEVISHIHPCFLPVVFSEIERILMPGGLLFISDCNNLGYPPLVKDRLLPLYNTLENGPDGTVLGDVVVQMCISNQRKQIIRSRQPNLSPADVDHLASNTSGLFGDYLNQVVDRFALTGELIRRPHRKRFPPVYPESGQVEERGFYPEGVVYDLMSYGFACTILDVPSRAPSSEHFIPLASSRMKPADGYGAHAFQVEMPIEYQDNVVPVLLENDRPLPLPTDCHTEICEKGMGRYSVWKPDRTIYFSSSDNSDPRTNDRTYALYWRNELDDRIAYRSPNFQIVAVKPE